MADGDETAPGDEPPAEEPSKAFFLALAAKGKETWNAWRRDPANKDAYVTFKGVDFSVAPRDGIDFSGFEFGDWADFSQCKWGGGDWDQVRGAYPDVFKLGRACFTDASFGHSASFEGAAFGDFASFTSAAFGDLATFKGATFGAYASFDGRASFGDRASFEGAVLGFGARFGAVDFHGSASFGDATFGEGAMFDGAMFGGITSFAGAAFGDWTFFDLAVFKGPVTFKGKSISSGPAPDRFQRIFFARARFEDDAVFSDRFFERAANFTDARFSRPPDFDAVTNASRIDFTGAHISFVSRGKLPWDSEVPVRLRAFRKIAEETKNHDLERELYIEERKAERGVYVHRTLRRAEKGAENGEGAHLCAARRPWPLDHRHVVVLGARQLWPQLRSAPRVALCERVYLSFRVCFDPRAPQAESGPRQ